MDLQTFMNAGVSLQGQTLAGASGPSNGDGLTIERVMDWIEARMEALKEEDDSEDDGTDKERGKAPTRGNGGNPATQRQHTPAASTSTPPRMLPPSRSPESKRNGRRSPDRDRGDHHRRQQNSIPTLPPSSRHSSPSSPHSTLPTISGRPVGSRKERERQSLPAGILQNLQHYPFDFAIPIPPSSWNHPHGLGLITDPSLTTPLPITIINSDSSIAPTPTATPTTGSKRRHASIAGADPVPPTGTPARPVTHAQTQNSASRRRNRGGRLSTGPGSNRSIDPSAGVGGMLAHEPMEVEERARKVPRR